ncbi:Major facilitator superfamily transporter [Acididesulfobacillus acetoxydans]|uniref:Inner membrane metabolite transport protein YdjE n=1 Tax=Acididesulfobacillus acetoxydans TaxID=1561005 RepID=A0A8S0W1X5_9FIRM|nr:MFS transporter [Acididesulfobacillus acetoxydans]CAA7600088.1 Major facilitator superfamily transporter [Acididesulfobacillus acetoxydans]CEJ07668.1 Inner membrane metabolite transport protein YdjE [Acididesulfobacillus acetoxydans]
MDANETAAQMNIPGRLERLPMTSFQRKLFTVIATAWLADQVDVALLSFLMGALTVYFHLTAVQIGFLASMTFAGQLAGNVLVGVAADRFGRKMTFQISMIIWGIASFLAAGAWSIGALMVFRFLIGLGVGGEAPVAQALVSEFVPADVRGKYIAFMEGFWAVGYVLSGGIAYFLLPRVGWRWVFVVVGLLSIVIFFVRRHLPESPRWLADKGRIQEANVVLTGIEREIAKRTNKPLPAAKPFFAELSTQKNSILTLFDKMYLKRTFMAFGLWFFSLLGFFGLSSWMAVLLNSRGISITQSVGFLTLITTGGIPGFFVAAYLLEKVGRKPTTVLFLIMSAVTAYLYGQSTDYTMLFITGFIMQFFMFGMWSCLYAYTPELYPTHARSTGAGFSSAFGRIGAIAGPVIVGYVVNTIGQVGVFSLGAISFAIAALLVLALGIETKGLTLEEISK